MRMVNGSRYAADWLVERSAEARAEQRIDDQVGLFQQLGELIAAAVLLRIDLRQAALTHILHWPVVGCRSSFPQVKRHARTLIVEMPCDDQTIAPIVSWSYQHHHARLPWFPEHGNCYAGHAFARACHKLSPRGAGFDRQFFEAAGLRRCRYFHRARFVAPNLGEAYESFYHTALGSPGWIGPWIGNRDDARDRGVARVG